MESYCLHQMNSPSPRPTRKKHCIAGHDLIRSKTPSEDLLGMNCQES